MVNLISEKKAKKFIFFIGSLFLIGIFILLVYISSFKKIEKLPQEFFLARKEVNSLTQEIVNLTNQTRDLIKEVNLSEFSGEKNKALFLIQEAKKVNEDAYRKAFNLSVAVQKLAESLNKIEEGKKRQLIYEAASIQLGLISNFINYTQDLNDFLASLSITIVNETPENRLKVQDHLSKVNQRIAVINNLSQAFISKMKAITIEE